MIASGCDILFDGLFQTKSPVVLHSVFSRAANMLCDDALYSIVARAGYDAPATATVEDDRLFAQLAGREGSYVRRLDGCRLHFDPDLVLDCSSCDRETSRLRAYGWDEGIARSGLEGYALCASALREEPEALALYRSFSHGGHPAPGLREEGSLTGRLSAFVEAVASGRCPSREAVRVLGTGPGLTPAGDDFLCGFVCACTSTSNPRAKEWLADLRRSLAEDNLVTKTTIVSATMLEHACAGLAASPYRAFCRALLSRPETMAESLEALARVGASSGLDFSAGAAFAVRLLLEGEG